METVFKILNFWFKTVFEIQKKMIFNEKLESSKKKMEKIFCVYLIVYICLFVNGIKIINVIFTIIGLILLFVCTILRSMDSLKEYISKWFYLKLIFPSVIYFYIQEKIGNMESILKSIIFDILFVFVLILIESFVDTDVAMKANGIYTIIFTIINKFIGKENLKESYEILKIVDEISLDMICIFGIITIFLYLKEHWIKKYNNGMDVLELKKEYLKTR